MTNIDLDIQFLILISLEDKWGTLYSTCETYWAFFQQRNDRIVRLMHLKSPHFHIWHDLLNTKASLLPRINLDSSASPANAPSSLPLLVLLKAWSIFHKIPSLASAHAHIKYCSVRKYASMKLTLRWHFKIILSWEKKKKINRPFTFTQYNLTVLRFSCEWRLLTASVFERLKNRCLLTTRFWLKGADVQTDCYMDN